MCEMRALRETACFSEQGLLSQASIEEIAEIMQKCSRERNEVRAMCLYDFLRRNHLENHNFLGDYLVTMLVAVGNIRNAQQVFNGLEHPSIICINCLINSYVKCGKPQNALSIYQQKLRDHKFFLDTHTIVALLKASGKLRCLETATEMHAEAARVGLIVKDCYIGSSLIDTYAKCGKLRNAQEVFDMLPIQDVVSWTALIAGYVEHGYEEEALNCFEQMRLQKISPNAFTLVYSVKACASMVAIKAGHRIHAEIEMKGLLETDPFLGSGLIDMYSKCGSLAVSESIFKRILVRDVVLWTALMSAYIEHGFGEEAVNCFEQMQAQGVSPNVVTYICCLKACGDIGAAFKGQEIHFELERQGLDTDVVVAGALVGMYAKCGQITRAREIVDRFPMRNTVIWNALILGYAAQECDKDVLECFETMREDRIVPNATTFICVLNTAGRTKDVRKVQELHAEIAKIGLLEQDIAVGNSLVDSYVKCGLLSLAQKVFDELPERDVYSWTTLVTGYAEYGYDEKFLDFFAKMKLECVPPNAIPYVSCLKACDRLGDRQKFREIHSEIERQGLVERDIVIGNTVVHLYAKDGLFSLAREIFDRLLERDTISWTSLIAGYAEHGHGDEALECFRQMQRENVSANAVTYMAVLKACTNFSDICKGTEIHLEIEHQDMLRNDIVIGNTLLNMYAKCGCVVKAQKVFDKLSYQNVASWTALLGAHAGGNGQETIKFFDEMQHGGILPDARMLTRSLKACGNIGATAKGDEIHANIERCGLIERGVIGNTIVNMYAKFGLLVKAAQVLENLPSQDVVAWTSLMTGYVNYGESDCVFHIFDKMLEGHIEPDEVTFTVLLHACKYSCEIARSQAYFEAMWKEYGVLPVPQHFVCLVNLLGCMGRLYKAVEIIKKMPLLHDCTVWDAVLSACRKWGDTKLGKNAFEQALLLRKEGSTSYVLMTQMNANGQILDVMMNVCQG